MSTIRANYIHLSPTAAQAMNALEKTVSELPIDKKIFDLIKIRASQLNGCIYCLDMHVKEAKVHEERELRLYHVACWRESPLFSAKERAALAWTETLTRTGGSGVSDGEYEVMSSTFTDKEISDITFVISTINAWNRLGIAFQPKPGSLDKYLGLEKANLQ